MRAIAAVVLAVVLAAPVMAHEAKPATGTYGTKIELPARDSYEECVELGVGQRLVYGYSASHALQFNIHYHVGDKMSYPVRKNTRNVRAAYVPHKAQDYCLMWTNPRTKPVTLEFSFSVGAVPTPGK